MNTSIRSMQTNTLSSGNPGNRTLRSGLSLALAVCALTAWNARAHATELDPITVSAPIIKTLPRDAVTEMPMEDITVKAHIAVDKETLRNDSGVVLLRDRVLEAAQDACHAADPFMPDDGTCVRDAVKAAKPQVEAAIASARNSAVG